MPPWRRHQNSVATYAGSPDSPGSARRGTRKLRPRWPPIVDVITQYAGKTAPARAIHVIRIHFLVTDLQASIPQILYIQKMAPILVIFHMDGCPHCPPVLAASKQVKDAHVLTVESRNPMTTELGISSYPSIWLSLPGDLFEFQSSSHTQRTQRMDRRKDPRLAQDIVDPLTRGRDTAQAAPGALDGDEAAVVLVGGRTWARLQGKGGFGERASS